MDFASWVQFGETPSPDVHIPAKHIIRGSSLFIRFFLIRFGIMIDSGTEELLVRRTSPRDGLETSLCPLFQIWHRGHRWKLAKQDCNDLLHEFHAMNETKNFPRP